MSTRSFLVALQFLTALPIRLAAQPSPEVVGRSLIYYPLVGLLIGALLAGLSWLLSAAPAPVAAASLLTVWVMITGALHLDGLADSADAWLGGLGDRDKTLAIMKDPYCGPAAVVTLILVLFIKFTALAYLVARGHWAILLIVPMLGRIALVGLFLTTPYVRAGGLGSSLARHLPRRACILAVILGLVFAALVLGSAAIGLLVVALLAFVMSRRYMLRRLGGTTGDTAGALVELSEAVALWAAALIPFLSKQVLG